MTNTQTTLEEAKRLVDLVFMCRKDTKEGTEMAINHAMQSLSAMKQSGRDEFLKQFKQCKLTYDQVLKIREIGRSKTQEEIAKMFGVKRKTISDILANKTWVVS